MLRSEGAKSTSQCFAVDKATVAWLNGAMAIDLFSSSVDPAQIASLVDEARSDVRYIVTDFPVELLVSRFREEAEEEGEIYIPSYQRALAWTEDQGSYLIESLLLKVPIPPIFLYDVKGKLEIVDGSQRIRSLVNFFANKFALVGLEKLDVLNGLHFDDLPLEVQRRLRNTPIRSFVIEEGTDASMRVELFRRLNTSGKKLQDAEIRKGAFRGPFMDLVIASAESELFKNLTPHLGGKTDPKSERQELVTRYYVYSDNLQDFRHDVRKFLDGHTIELNKKIQPAEVESARSEFDRTMQFITANFPKAFYRSDRSKRVPRVRFEAVAVGTNLALRQSPNINVGNLDWLVTDEFKALVRTDASNSGPKLRARIEYVRDSLLQFA